MNDTSNGELHLYHCISSLQTFSEKAACMAQLACPMFMCRRELLPFPPHQLLKAHISLFRNPKWRNSPSRLLHSMRIMIDSHGCVFKHTGDEGVQMNSHVSVFLRTGHEFLKNIFRSNDSCSRTIRGVQGPAASPPELLSST